MEEVIESLINQKVIFDSTGQRYILPFLLITILLIIGRIIYEKNYLKNNSGSARIP